MSHEPSHATEHMPPPSEQAQEGIQWPVVLGVGAGALIVFTVAVLIVLNLLHAREKALQPQGPDPIRRQLGEMEIGIVDQVPFDVARALQSYRSERLDRLEHWGWVDKKAGIVHMPIGDAMDAVVKENRK